MSADGRFIVTFEKVTFEKADVCEEALVASWADGVEDPRLSVFVVGVLTWLQPWPLKLFPVCSAAEWFASHTLPLAVKTLQECLNEQVCPLLQPFALL